METNVFEGVSTIEDLDKRFLNYSKLYKEDKDLLGKLKEEYESIRDVMMKAISKNEELQDAIIASLEREPKKDYVNEYIKSLGLSNRELIDRLFNTRLMNGYARGWVYYRFIEGAVNPTIQDFEYLAIKLGYSKGWAYYKKKEYDNAL